MAPSSASKKGPLTHSGSQEGSRVKNFKLGEVLGKGSAGTVYKSLNMNTGDVVAIKQVPLRNIPKGDIGQIMREIHLLNHLDHNNIVKYMDSVKTKDHLNIVLEFVENGSLANTVKRFGSLPESLIAIYVEQVPYSDATPTQPIPSPPHTISSFWKLHRHPHRRISSRPFHLASSPSLYILTSFAAHYWSSVRRNDYVCRR